MSNAVKDRLSKMNARYQESEQQAKAMFVEIDPGVYLVKLANAEIVESKASGRLQIKRLHIVTEGDMKGANIYDYMGLESELGFAFIREWVTKLGYECPTDATDLPDLLQELTDKNPVVQVKVTKSDGGFTNVRVISLEDSGVDTTTDAPISEDPPAGETVPTADPELFVLAQAHGAEVDDSMADADIISAMETASLKLNWKELTEEEQNVILRHELKRFVQVDKPRAPIAPAKPPVKPLAKPAPAPLGKKPLPAPVGKKPLPLPAKKK